MYEKAVSWSVTRGRGGGGTPSGKGYRMWSWGCREQTMLKKGGCPVIIGDYRELSNMFILRFYIKLQVYAFKDVQETLQNKLFGKIKSNKH